MPRKPKVILVVGGVYRMINQQDRKVTALTEKQVTYEVLTYGNNHVAPKPGEIRTIGIGYFTKTVARP